MIVQAAQIRFFSNVFIQSKNKDIFGFVLCVPLLLVAFTQGPIFDHCKEFSPVLAFSLELALHMSSFRIAVKLTMAQTAFSKEHPCLEDC